MNLILRFMTVRTNIYSPKTYSFHCIDDVNLTIVRIQYSLPYMVLMVVTMVTGDRPTWPQLISLRCPAAGDQPLRVIKWITSCGPTKCADLAHLLLRDDVTVEELQMKNADNDLFVRAVLREWLNRADDDHNEPAAPRTWAALAECVQDADLPGALAKAIRDATAPLPPAAVQSELLTAAVVGTCTTLYIL